MTILQSDVIDTLSIESGICVMTISDHLEWDTEQHMKLLEKKINFYFSAIFSGEVNKIEGYERINSFLIQLIYKYRPDDETLNILEDISRILIERNVSFEFGEVDDFYS